MIRIVDDTGPQERVLIFSTQDRSFDSIIPDLTHRGISCALLKGSSSQRASTIRKYKEGTIQALCLNSLVNGAGLDLPTTDHLILYHPMPRHMEQVIQRAQRTGRTGPLTVHLIEAE